MTKQQKRAPRKKRKHTKPSSKTKLINLVLLMMVLTLTVTILSYFVILEKFNKNKTTQIQKEATYKESDLNNYRKEILDKYFNEDEKAVITQQEKKQPQITQPKEEKKLKEEKAPLKQDQFEEYTEEFEKDYLNHPKEPHVFPKPKKEEKVKEPKPVVAPIIDKRPKLAIVIDDVTISRQVRSINNIGYKVTMSFMPPTKQHKNSAKIAQNLPFYIVHFPLQAKSFKFEEENTLHVGDSYEKIEKRVAQVRKWYPQAVYTNNHTGSKFTSDDQSMDYLIKALKKYDFIFMDSRTTAHSVVKKYTKKYGMPYIARNIFLDNTKDYDYIQKQLKKAIKIAKKTGSAIAIGHPYGITIKVLKESKSLLKGLNLVYVNEIPLKK